MKIIDLLFPKRCVFCGKLVQTEEEICEKCKDSKNLIKIMPKTEHTMFIDEKIFAAWYKDEVRYAVHRFKYNRKTGYGRVFAKEMYKQYILNSCKYDLFCFVPSNRYTVFKRGYNQAEVLAKELGKLADKSVIRAVEKTRKTKPMYSLTPSQRRANVLGAYKLSCDKKDIEGKDVLIVDDIFTTGATSSEIAKVLRMNGAVKIGCATFAYKK